MLAYSIYAATILAYADILLPSNKILKPVQVICIEDEAFFSLIDRVVERLKEKNPERKDDKWILGTEAMNLLRIKSKTTLQKLRDEGKIRFTQPEKKIVLYDRQSIDAYLEDFTYETF